MMSHDVCPTLTFSLSPLAAILSCKEGVSIVPVCIEECIGVCVCVCVCVWCVRACVHMCVHVCMIHVDGASPYIALNPTKGSITTDSHKLNKSRPTWTDGVAVNTIRDEINGDTLSQPNHSCLRCSIHKPVGCSLEGEVVGSRNISLTFISEYRVHSLIPNLIPGHN